MFRWSKLHVCPTCDKTINKKDQYVKISTLFRFHLICYWQEAKRADPDYVRLSPSTGLTKQQNVVKKYG